MTPLPTRSTPTRSIPSQAAVLFVVLALVVLLVAAQVGLLVMLPTQVASALAGVAPTADGRDITLMVGGYQVLGRFDDLVDDPHTVFAELLAPDGTVRASTMVESNEQGTVELAFTTRDDAPRRPVLIRPGDTVSLRLGASGAAPNVYEAGTISAEAEAAANAVTGTAPPDAEVTVTARSGDFSAMRRVTSDAHGTWSADFSDEIEFARGTRGIAMWGEGNGAVYVAHQTSWVVRELTLEVGSDTLALPATPGEVARAEMADSSGQLLGSAEAVAWDDHMSLWLHTIDGTRAPISTGTLFTLTLNTGETVSREIPEFYGWVLAEHNTVYGEAPAYETIRITAGDVVSSTVVDGTGAWAFLFGERDVVSPETVVDVSLDGYPWVRYGARARQVVSVDPHEARLMAADAPLRLATMEIFVDTTLDHHHGVRAPERGRAFEIVGAAGGSVYRWGKGDTARLWWPSSPLEFEVAPLTAAVDPVSKTVSGSTVPSAAVEIGVLGTSVPVTADLEGRWSAQLDPALELAPGTPIGLDIVGPGAYRSSTSFPIAQVSAQVGGSRVRIDGPPSTEATVEVERSDEVVATGACSVDRTRCEAVMRGAGGARVRMQPGDTVSVHTAHGEAATLKVLPLTAHIDASGRDVVGQAPPNSEVHIEFGSAPGAALPLLHPRNATTRVFRSGVYDYELLGSELELVQPGLVADVFYVLPSGHRLFAVAAMEVVWAEPGSDSLQGVAEPGAAVSATWRLDDGTVAASGSAVAGDQGVFVLDLLDADASHTTLGNSGTLSVTHGRGVRSFELEGIHAWRWDASGAVLGRAPAGTPVVAAHRRTAVAPSREYSGGPHIVAGAADAYGRIDLENPGVDVSYIQYIELVAQLPSGDEIHAWVGSTPPGRVYLPWTARP